MMENLEKGRAFLFDYRVGAEAREKALAAIIASAKEELPPGKVFEVRAKYYPREGCKRNFNTENYPFDEQCENWGVAWYSRPEDEIWQAQELFCRSVDNGYKDELLGCLLIGRLKS